LEWARLNDVLRYCIELEDTAADLAAVRELMEGGRNPMAEAKPGKRTIDGSRSPARRQEKS